MKLFCHAEEPLFPRDFTAKVEAGDKTTVADVRDLFVAKLNKKLGGGAAQDPSQFVLENTSCIQLDLGAHASSLLVDGQDLMLVAGNGAVAGGKAPAAPAKTMLAGKAGKSQASKGENSYYYAHSKASDAVPVPEPKKLATRSAGLKDGINLKTFADFGFYDDGDKVKVQVPCKGAGKLPKDTITCDFRERSFDLTAQTSTIDCFRLHVPILLETVVPESCKIMVKPDKIVVSLKKVKDDFNWYELRKTKGVGETQIFDRDSGETTRVVNPGPKGGGGVLPGPDASRNEGKEASAPPKASSGDEEPQFREEGKTYNQAEAAAKYGEDEDRIREGRVQMAGEWVQADKLFVYLENSNPAIVKGFKQLAREDKRDIMAGRMTISADGFLTEA